jgi:probable addiction module antidote protein
MVKKLSTRPYDAAAYLKTEQEWALYLQAAIDESDGDPALVVAALGDIARARGMMQLARETGLTREGLYKALSPEGNPSFATVMKAERRVTERRVTQSAGSGLAT